MLACGQQHQHYLDESLKKAAARRRHQTFCKLNFVCSLLLLAFVSAFWYDPVVFRTVNTSETPREITIQEPQRGATQNLKSLCFIWDFSRLTGPLLYLLFLYGAFRAEIFGRHYCPAVVLGSLLDNNCSKNKRFHHDLKYISNGKFADCGIGSFDY